MAFEINHGTVHLRSVRPKRRRQRAHRARLDFRLVFTRCGKWAPNRLAVRVDRATVATVCASCIGAG